MERIVLEYDDGPPSDAALSWTAERARLAPTRIDVVVDAEGAARSEMIARLADAEALLRARAPSASVAPHRLESGAADELSALVEHADLVVAGTAAGHPSPALLAGVSALGLSVRSATPMVLVPPRPLDTADPITVGVGPTGSSEDALAFAAAEAALHGAPLRLVHSWLMRTPSFCAGEAQRRTPAGVAAEHAEVLGRASAWVRARHPDVVLLQELVRDSPASALRGFADRSSLVAIGAAGRAVPGGAIGAVAEEVLWHAECPVVVVPARPPGDA